MIQMNDDLKQELQRIIDKYVTNTDEFELDISLFQRSVKVIKKQSLHLLSFQSMQIDSRGN